MTFYIGFADPAEDGSWGVVFPDLPGCCSAGATPDDLFENSIEAVRLWAESALAAGEQLPPPRGLGALLADPAVAAEMDAVGPTWMTLQVPLLIDAGRNVRANISLDAGLLATIDEAARQRGLTRSTFLASAAREKIERSR